jgi:hypothetical protein
MNTDDSRDPLPPAELSRNLIYAGLFMLAYELVKPLVIERVKGFYANTTFGSGMPFTTYEQDVLSRHKSAFEASLLYLRDHFEAINSQDIMDIQSLRTHRNVLAHELSRMLHEMDPEQNEQLLLRARSALSHLSRFWMRIELGADPDFLALDPDWDTVVGEDLILLDQVIETTHAYRMADRAGA